MKRDIENRDDLLLLMQEFYKICKDCLAKVPVTEKKCPECNADMS